MGCGLIAQFWSSSVQHRLLCRAAGKRGDFVDAEPAVVYQAVLRLQTDHAARNESIRGLQSARAATLKRGAKKPTKPHHRRIFRQQLALPGQKLVHEERCTVRSRLTSPLRPWRVPAPKESERFISENGTSLVNNSTRPLSRFQAEIIIFIISVIVMIGRSECRVS